MIANGTGDFQQGLIDYEIEILGALIPSGEPTVEAEELCAENLNFLLLQGVHEKLSYEGATLVKCMLVYREETQNRGVLTEEILVDMMVTEGVPPEKTVKYQELFNKAKLASPSVAKFRYAISRFREMMREKEFLEALGNTFQIDRTGLKMGKHDLKGFQAARQFLAEKLYELDKSVHGNVPEGEMSAEAEAIWEEYQARKIEPEKFKGIMTGVAELDNLTNGFQNGELIIIGAYTAEGKSTLSMNIAHHAATRQGKNVVLLTAEVPYVQYRRRTAVLHTRNSEFGLPHGISYEKLKLGQLSPEHEQGFQQALKDLKENQTYGKLVIVQVPKGAGLEYVHNKLNAYNVMFPIHLVVIDSLNLLTPLGKGENKRWHMDDMIKEAKQLAINFDRGRGIPIISPWQANRKSWDEAKKVGHYTLASWSEASELEKSADLLMWLLRGEKASETHELIAGVAKYRDGKTLDNFMMYEDFDGCYVGSLKQAGGPGSGMAAPTFAPPVENLF